MALLTCPNCGEQYYGVGCPKCDFPQKQATEPSPAARRVMGLIALAVGIGCSLPGFLQHGPPGQRALVFVVAGIFTLAGLQILTGAKGRLGALMGTAIAAGLSLMMFVAAFGPGKVRGGLPFLPDSWNQHLGRFAFGAFGVLAGFMALYWLWQAMKPAWRKS